jgi:ectoine hydroxylase-related dioxygenase (phytanoyl-CoA dioxygenase family)
MQRLKKILQGILLCAQLNAGSFSTEQKAFFEENGYLGPLPFFSQGAAVALAKDLERQIQLNPSMRQRRPGIDASSKSSEEFRNDSLAPYGQPRYWSKSLHILSSEVAAMGRSEEFSPFIQELLGPDILLWGAQLVGKPPGEAHRWHVDIEHRAWDGVTFWLPLSNVSQESTIKFIPGSHHFDSMPQSLPKEVDLENDQALLDAIREAHPMANVVSMDIKPGEFVLFAGRTWHSTMNRSKLTRKALIFQYCRPDARVRIPLNFVIPTLWSPDQPWVLLIRGEDRYGINHIFQ